MGTFPFCVLSFYIPDTHVQCQVKDGVLRQGELQKILKTCLSSSLDSQVLAEGRRMLFGSGHFFSFLSSMVCVCVCAYTCTCECIEARCSCVCVPLLYVLRQAPAEHGALSVSCSS